MGTTKTVPAPARREAMRESISDLELSVNTALIVWGNHNPELRRLLLTFRGDVREAIGEART